MYSAQFMDENVNDEIEYMEYDELFNKELEKEILKDLTLMLDSKAGAVRLLKRRSRQSGGSGADS